MSDYTSKEAHTFHIPVLGTGFTIDTPLRVARYGISSVISLVDDVLIEQMRKFYCKKENEPYEEITNNSNDARAQRITAYLNLLDRLLQRQVDKLQSSAFEKGSEISKYYDMLPDNSKLKKVYLNMADGDSLEKNKKQEMLRLNAVPGSIDVNIMTKLDRPKYRNGKELSPEFSDAMAAMRGFANSTLCSSIIFSAGINKQLYRYIAEFKDFFPDQNGVTKKKIVLKVSDYRSSEIQGRFLAKLGLWVSEFRIESGLNCGGHAFASKGHLLGVALEEFKQKKDELFEKLLKIYSKANPAAVQNGNTPPKIRVTVQGGIGTADEQNFLLKYYEVDSVGWGTPFLLVPEAVSMDKENLKKLLTASEKDVFLSNSSPMGIPFWNLRNSASEERRRARIRNGKPGSSCLKGFVSLNTEFTEKPICLASRAYQKKKLELLEQENHPPVIMTKIKDNILAKSCICHDLGGSATLENKIDPEATPAVCCGPGIVDFSKIATLEEMAGHIYGRLSLLKSKERPHVFIKELGLYVDYLRNEIENFPVGLSSYTSTYLKEMRENLIEGIEYYQTLSSQLVEGCRDRFQQELKNMQAALEPLTLKKV
jgi:hypothetical protein